MTLISGVYFQFIIQAFTFIIIMIQMNYKILFLKPLSERNNVQGVNHQGSEDNRTILPNDRNMQLWKRPRYRDFII